MSTRSEIDAIAKENVAQERQEAKLRKEELKPLSRGERKAAEKVDRKLAKEAKKARKSEIKALPADEQRVARKIQRREKSLRKRKRRVITWTAVLVVIALVAYFAAPYVSDIRRLTGISITSDTPEGVAARAQAVRVSEQLSDEGIVLLKNDDQALPLTNKKINVFGFASMNPRFGGSGSGAADQSRSVNFYDALTQQGFTYNPDLYKLLVDSGADPGAKSATGLGQIVSMLLGRGVPHDPDPSYLSDDLLSAAKTYSDTAMVFFGNDGIEMADFANEQLRLSENQLGLLRKVTSLFDKVIIVINSGNTMELGFLDDYPQIKGALSIGTPGPRGAVSLAKILDGTVNPSGRLTDTFAYDVSSAPAAVNFGSFKYSNFKRYFLNYNEGIYVGYRYYETRYEDDPAGYAQAVQFPFGYGLSYTEFSISSANPIFLNDQIYLSATVTNTGSTAGKEVVQFYYSPPYLPGGIEKSSIELLGYAKTKLLAPGESQTINLTFHERDLASWDSKDTQAWVLDAGEYQLHVARNVHDIVDSFSFSETTRQVFDEDETTGTALTNQFEYAEGDLKYLSRTDWTGTFPDNANLNYTASQQLLDEMKASPLPSTDLSTAPKLGVDHGLQLADMQGVPYDDPKWQQFVEQFTADELITLFSKGGYQTEAIDRLGVPAATLLDGPAGISFFFGKMTAASYPTALVIAQTWNNDLAYLMGQTVGTEANAYGVEGWYAPGMNIHRTAKGGRNFEYYSEDPVLSGKMGANIVAGAQTKNVLTFMKHFALNEQETNARSGINIWANEQSIRELYLKPFEITVKEGAANGAMSSFVHIGTKWSGGNPELLQNVLRDEWGFTGIVTTDAVLGSWMDPRLAAQHGNELMLAPFPTNTVRSMQQAYQTHPNLIGTSLQDRAHTTCYALLQTELFR